MELLPCRFCDAVPEPEIRRPTRHTDYNAIGHECLGPYRVTPEAAAAEWNAANAPADPALLALARLGAWALDHDDIYDSDRRAAGALMMDGCAPGDVSALAARLLAPDGAASEGVTG